MDQVKGRNLLRTEQLVIRGFDEYGINFTLSPGSRIGILGGTGSGKTNLLRALARLDPVSEGKLFWGERDVSRKVRLRKKLRQHYVSLLLANPYTFFDPSIRTSEYLHDVENKTGTTAVKLLRDKNIPEAASEHPAAALSGVMRIRLALIRIQHNASPVVLIDDIFRHLVPDVWQNTLESICSIVDGSQALLIASRFSECLQSMDYILVIHDGHFIEGGPSAKVLNQPAHPITRTLVHSKGDDLLKPSRDDAEMMLKPNNDVISIAPGHWVLADHQEMTLSQ